MSEYYCAIDIGSNAMRAIIGFTIDGTFTHYENYRYPLRLGDEVFLKGKISEKKINQTLCAFSDLAKKLSKYKVKYVKALATSALRDATNSGELLAEVYQKHRINIEVVDGKTEAKLIKKAISSSYNLDGKSSLMIDIGGGSTEITFTKDNKIKKTLSYQLGTVRLLHNQLSNKNEDKSHLIFKQIQRDFYGSKIDFAFGTGGNLRRMGKLRKQLLHKKSSNITLEDLKKIRKKVSSYTLDERVNKLSMRRDRADVIIPALDIICTILQGLNINVLNLPNLGLKEGILVYMSENPRKLKAHRT